MNLKDLNLIDLIILLLKATAVFLIKLVIKVLLVFYLWNWLAPIIFNLPMINYAQALGIIAFIHILSPIELSTWVEGHNYDEEDVDK